MGKNKKKRKQSDKSNEDSEHVSFKTPKRHSNPLQAAQQSFLQSLPVDAREHFFSNNYITPDQRAEIWEIQADIGEKLINKYAWATPDERVLKVFQHFGPIVEVGCGSNAYWANWMNAEGGVDVIAFDVSLESGGKIGLNNGDKKQIKSKQNDGTDDRNRLVIRRGGPSSLSSDPDICDSDRALFLCYPDEEEYEQSESENEEDSYTGHDIHASKPKSMAAACLEHFNGSTIIHVGELFGDTLGLDQSPWGRSSSTEFQERLSAEYHCILKMKLQNNWLHVRDTLSVWKRSETCAMVYENDSEDEDGSADEDHYKYIPPEETLPMDVAAPCVAHLLSNYESHRKGDQREKKLNQTIAKNKDEPKMKKKTKLTKVTSETDQSKKKQDAIAGNAW
jgi:hypothetical protein